MSFDKKKISDIVDNNYVNASVLYYFGISFFDYSEETLAQACQKKGLDVKVVIEKLEASPNANDDNFLSLQEYPIDLIIAYLKHTHYLFIKMKLPYLAQLINKFKVSDNDYKPIADNLKFVFPLFVEDFIHHIYEEEDTLFSYIMQLDAYMKGKGNPSALYWQMEKHSLQKFAMEHDEHDDEMSGIRGITKNYTIEENTPLTIKVIYSEMKALETSLKTHARVENEVLFPKALMLEKEAKLKMESKIKLN